MNGQLVHFNGPQDARAVGIETVYQDLALAPDLDAAANVFLGRELLRPGLLGRLGVLDKPRMVRQTGEAMARLGVTIRPSAEVLPFPGVSGRARRWLALQCGPRARFLWTNRLRTSA